MLKFLQRTYAEMHAEGEANLTASNLAASNPAATHLTATVDQYFSRETPLWWVDLEHAGLPSTRLPIACLWMGTAIDQVQGDRHAHIFLLYVEPSHRRQGIGTALMQQAEAWARDRGDQQIGLQVFQSNQAARTLYETLGFQVQSLWMVKSLH